MILRVLWILQICFGFDFEDQFSYRFTNLLAIINYKVYHVTRFQNPNKQKAYAT